MASTTEQGRGLLAKPSMTDVAEEPEGTEQGSWQKVIFRQNRKSVVPTLAAGGQRPSAYQGPNAHQRSNAYEKPYAYQKSNTYQNRQGGTWCMQNSQAPAAYSQYSRATRAHTYRDVNFRDIFEVGDVVTSLDLTQAFLTGPPSSDEHSGSSKDIDMNDQETKEEKLEQGVASMLMGKKRVEVSAKKRPGVVIAVFKERMTVVYMFTHGNQGWRATDRKPQESKDAAFYLTTDKARKQYTPGDGFEAYPGAKRLLWTKTHDSFQDKDSVLYVDALSTIYANVVIGAEKKGCLDNESLGRLLSAVKGSQFQGSWKPVPTQQVHLQPITSAAPFAGPLSKFMDRQNPQPAPSAAETADLQAPAMKKEKSNPRVAELRCTSDAEKEQKPAATNDNKPVFDPLSGLRGTNKSNFTLTSATVAIPKLTIEMLATVAMPNLNLGPSSSHKLSRKPTRKLR